MDVSHWILVVALVLGAAVMVTGFLRRRRRGGHSQVLLGVALMVGPWSPLLQGHVAFSVQIAISLAAVAFTVARVIVAFGRLRRAQR